MELIELLEIYFLTVMQRGSETGCNVARGQYTHRRHWRLTVDRESRMEVTKDQKSLESSGQTHSFTQVKTLFVHTRIKVCNRETGGGRLA